MAAAELKQLLKVAGEILIYMQCANPAKPTAFTY